RLSFLLVGIWWLAFSQITFRRLPNVTPPAEKRKQPIFKAGITELKNVWQQVKRYPTLKRYLGAFFFYAIGVQTVMLVAAAFGEKTLHLGTSKLIITILLIQLIAIAGAF